MPETTQFGGGGREDIQSSGTLKANTVLMSRYRILGVLGGGGMGTVYQARDTHFPDAKRLVAIKEMQTPDSQLRASMIKSFRREANILATLSHPAIPKIFDFFDTEDRAYLIQEYINGSDLEMLLSKTKDLPVDKIMEWAIDLCDVLHYLHSHQPEPIIFRDLKPSNIMIDSLGKVRLIDFGIAKVFVSGVKHTMIGTEGYSAPEQYKGDVTPLSDIYGLGATLHHILTRRDPRLEPPFSFNERPILEINANVPAPLVNVVEKALAPKGEERFQSCADMKVAIEAIRYRSQSPVISVGQGNVGAATGNGAAGDNMTSFFDDIGPTGAIEPRWKFKTEDEIRVSAVVSREVVYVGSYDTNIWALNVENGEFMWKFPTNAGIASSPVIDTSSKLVLFGSEDRTFYAVDQRTGRINWSYVTKDKIRSSPRVAHDHVFFGSDDGKVYALVAGNGRFLWEYEMGSQVRTRPFVTNDLVIVGAEAGDVVALELSGKRKWAFRAKRGVNSSPYVDMKENICYVGAFDGFLYALDANSGYTLWRARTNGPIISSPVSNGELVFFGSTDGSFYAVNAETGKERWRFNTEKPIVGSPVIHESAIYFGGTDHYLYCIDIKTGKELWKFKAGSEITAAPCIADNMILIGSLDKTLYALPLVG